MVAINRIQIGPLELDMEHYELWFNKKSCRLAVRHCFVLERLTKDMGPARKVVRESELIKAVGRSPGDPSGAKMTQIIAEIRTAIEKLTGCDLVKIKNVPKTGYYLETDYIFTASQDAAVTQPSSAISLGGRGHLAMPTEDALAFATAFNARSKRIVGSVIEAYPHPFLGNDQPLAHIGWSPSDILLRLKDGLFDVSEISNDQANRAAFELSEEQRKSKGKGTALELPNNPKYMIVDMSSPFHDVTGLAVTLQKTDYFTILKARPGIASSPEARIRFGHLEPSRTRVPQGVAIQFMALFADGNVLTIHRAKDTFPWPDTWSFSGEEQYAEIDLAWDEPERMKRFLLRTAVEEIFPLARISQKDVLAGAMAYVDPYIRSMQTWSIFIEEPTVTLQFFSVFELSLTVAQYTELVCDLVQNGIGTMSNEGHYYAVSLRNIEPLLAGNDIPVTPLFGGDEEQILPTKLHPTSRYRLLRLLDHYSA